MRATSLIKTLSFLVAMLGVSTASPIPDFPFIMADGRVERDVPPTHATVTFVVVQFSKTAEEATNTVQSELTKMIAALKAEGVAENMIEAHDLDKSAVRKRNEQAFADEDILGYQVSRRVEIKLPDLGNYPKIARVMMKADHITYINTAFDTNKRDEVEAELMGEACAKARKKADLLAQGAGVKIDRVYAVSDQDFGDIRIGFKLDSARTYRGLEGEVAPSLPLFIPSTIELSASVNILYKLVP